MTDRERKYLSDIITSIELIYSFMEDINSFEDYCDDYKTKSAIERQLGIIGEAVNKYLKTSDEAQLNFASQIISLRNRLIHSYDNIDDTIIWTIINRHLIPLHQEVSSKLSIS
ncbi:HepT-like ribonuclease domain-containing protein [Marivirga sp.]|uniref:HepT-like ribonuclease domain-containing protein n=1 Tax=Marivirga sp. TaxID=2018662 RepID=UPI003DA726D8